MSSIKYFDNRSSENSESLNLSLSDQLQIFSQFNISDDINTAQTTTSRSATSTTDSEIDNAYIQSITTTGLVIFNGSTTSNYIKWNNNTNSFYIGGSLTVNNTSTFNNTIINGELTVRNKATINDLVVLNSFKLGNQQTEFTIIEATEEDNILIQNTIADKDLIFRLNIGGTNRDMLILDGSNQFIVGSGFDVACDINASTFDLDSSGA
ncbi:hypothetical protein N9T73_00045, partial [bacterium]|nr:hypothetical protein [bacterium]